MSLTVGPDVLQVADGFRSVLLLFLVFTAALLAIALLHIIMLHAARDVADRRKRRLVARYRPRVARLLGSESPADVLEDLRRSPRRHRRIIGELLLGPLRVATGDFVTRFGEVATTLGLVEEWMTDLADRRSWVRAKAAHALGLIRHAPAFEVLIGALDDAHPDVRAAALAALAALGDPRAVPHLVAKLGDESRYQRVRLVEALHTFGESATDALLAFGLRHPESRALLAGVLGLIGGAAAADDLLTWCEDDRADVRAAALGGLGTIGLNDQSYYYALRALGDGDGEVRVMAARALGRSGREDAARYLDEHLTDLWEVAAQCAVSLGMLGPAGLARLRARTGDQDQAGELARQFVWEREGAAGSAGSV